MIRTVSMENSRMNRAHQSWANPTTEAVRRLNEIQISVISLRAGWKNWRRTYSCCFSNHLVLQVPFSTGEQYSHSNSNRGAGTVRFESAAHTLPFASGRTHESVQGWDMRLPVCQHRNGDFMCTKAKSFTDLNPAVCPLFRTCAPLLGHLTLDHQSIFSPYSPLFMKYSPRSSPL